MPKFSVVIVNWNVLESVLNCINSVKKTHYPHLEIIVIDNASSDGSPTRLSKVPRITLIKNSANLGFRKGVNQGFNQATGDFVVVLNPDTLVPPTFFTDTLAFFATHPKAGIMGPRFVNPDGTPQGSVFPDPSLWLTIKEFWFNQGPLTAKYQPHTSVPIPVSNLSGACMVIPQLVRHQLGLFSEAVFMYYEDLDFCRRCHQLGYEVYYNPLITIVHEHGQSAAKSSQTQAYLKAASLWYNGPLKHYLMYFVSWSGQKLHHLFGS